MKYISLTYTIIVAFYSLTCSFCTLNYIFKTKFIKASEESFELKNLNHLSQINIINLNNNNQNLNVYDNLEQKERKNFISCVCICDDRAEDQSPSISINENYKTIDIKSKDHFDPEFIIKEKKYENKYNFKDKSKSDFLESEAKNCNYKSFLDNEYDIELQESAINNNKNNSELINCQKCCSNNEGKESYSNAFKSNNDSNSSRNFTMNPIYNYRNSKMLVLLNKRFLNFETTKNTASHFYFEIKLRIYEAFNLILVLFLIYNWILSRNWILNNFFAFSLCFVMLSFLTIRNFKICMILLSCIFFYDVFWVFFSKQIFKKNVMVEVAISLNIPIKLEFPRFFSYSPLNNCMILGLGDIILPGIIIKYCKNFDYLKFHNNIKDHLNYYSLSMKLYVVSLILAFLANFIFSHAQPVLFYIAPIFIIGLITNAVRNGELKDFLNGENYKNTQMCVDEIINTEFSKFEEGELQQKAIKKSKNESDLSSRIDITAAVSTKTNNIFPKKQNRNFIVLDEN